MNKQPMKLAEAKQKLMEIAKGGYHSMQYNISDHGDGDASQECKVYLPAYGWFGGAHWESAFSQLEAAMAGMPKLSEDFPVSEKK